jgi:GNAT superfamily N-acetyltransferase
MAVLLGVLLIALLNTVQAAWAPATLTVVSDRHLSLTNSHAKRRSLHFWSSRIARPTLLYNRSSETSLCAKSVAKSGSPLEASPFTHADITWKIRPEESASLWYKLYWRIAGILLRWQYRLQKRPLPRLLFPTSGQAVLLAYQGRRKLGRFGIVTQAGPSTPSLVETVRKVYQIPECVFVRAAAIIYMFVEPSVRGCSLGALALDAIGYLHAARGCDYTVLVANDKSPSQSLIQWYERHGYSRAPALQSALGSPDGIYGVTMIAPTKSYIPDDCVVEWW